VSEKRIKHFITIVPLAEPEALGSLEYKMGDITSSSTSFPIIALMEAAEIRENDDVLVTIIQPTGKVDTDNQLENHSNEIKNRRIEENLSCLQDELSTVGGTVISKVVPSKYDSDRESMQELRKNIQNAIGENEDIYVDITFGEKPQRVILYLEAAYIYATEKNGTKLKACIAGESNWQDDGTGVILDFLPFLEAGSTASGNAALVDGIAGGQSEPNDDSVSEEALLSGSEGYKDYEDYTKCFISVVPLTRNIAAKKYKNETGEYEISDWDRISPITQVMYDYIDKNDAVRVLLIKIADGNGYAAENQRRLIKEIKRLSEQERFAFENPDAVAEIIETDWHASADAMMRLKDRVVGWIKDYEKVFLDITFGETPVTIAIYSAVAEVLANKTATVLGDRMVYGYNPHTDDEDNGEHLNKLKYLPYMNELSWFFEVKRLKATPKDRLALIDVIYSLGGVQGRLQKLGRGKPLGLGAVITKVEKVFEQSYQIDNNAMQSCLKKVTNVTDFVKGLEEENASLLQPEHMKAIEHLAGFGNDCHGENKLSALRAKVSYPRTRQSEVYQRTNNYGKPEIDNPSYLWHVENREGMRPRYRETLKNINFSANDANDANDAG
jgi:hypothetical protein